MAEVKVEQLANEIGTPADRLVSQLADAGIIKTVNDSITEQEKEVLNLREVREIAESSAIRKAYMRADKNISKTAELLGITRPTLYSLIDKYHLEDLKTGM